MSRKPTYEELEQQILELKSLESERKQAEEKLEQSEKRFRSAIQLAPFPMMIHAEDGEVMGINQVWSELTGYAHEQISTIGDWTEKAYGQRTDIVKKDIDASFTLNKSEHLGEYPITTGNGEKIIWDFYSAPIGMLSDGRRIVLSMAMDITERKQVENKLKQSEKEYRDLFNNASDTIYIQDKEGRFLDINQSAVDMYGYPREFFIGKTPEFLSAPGKNDLEKILGFVNDAFDYKPQQFDFWGIRKNGEIFPKIVRMQKCIFKGKDAVITFALDIIKRKQAEEALQESELLMRQIIDTSPTSIFIKDRDGNYIVVNQAMAERHNTTPDALVGTSDLSLVGKWLTNKEDIEQFRASEREVIDQKKPLFNREEEFTYRDDTKAWFQTTKLPISVRDNPDCIMGVSVDITERKQAELELINAKELAEESESRFKALHNASFGGIAIHEKGIILECNQGLSEISGYSIKELIGMDGFLLIAPDSREMVMSNIVAKLEKPYYAKGVKKSGQEYALRLEARQIPYKGLEVRVVEFRDISEQKEIEAKQKTLESQLRQSQKLEAVGTMVGGISHELNNILQTMFLYSGIIEEQLPEDENLKENFKQLQASADKARDIVKQILTFSRKTGVDLKHQPIHELILESLALERASIPANIEIKQDIDMHCGKVLCDKTQIHQIIINLCNNAEHAMKDGGGILSVSLQSAHKTIGKGDLAMDALELTISDTGHGMDSPELERIFDPFFTTKQFGQGTGLGLSVIHGIVEIMGGQISVTSEVAKGTTFRILLPVVDGVEEIHTPQKVIAQKNDFNMSILLVDDEESIRQVTQTILRRRGFAVESTSDGQKAFELFKANPNKYNLIVTDLSMPIMSGMELCQAIRASGSDIPIMLSTGHLDIEDQQEYENVDITKSIQKPWTADELIARIQEMENE